MRPGEIAPSGHDTTVSPPAAQLQPTQVICPFASTATCPPLNTLPGNSTLPLSSLRPSPAVTSQVPAGIGARTSQTSSPPASGSPASVCPFLLSPHANRTNNASGMKRLIEGAHPTTQPLGVVHKT